jgi:3-oxoacyl-[acyl-carrier-protein] synthase-1
MSADMHILAVGARTPAGLQAESSTAAIRAGIIRIGPHPTLVDVKGDKLIAGRDAKLESAIQGPKRLAALAGSVVAEVARKLAQRFRTSLSAGPRVTVLLGLPEVRPGFTGKSADEVARALSNVPLPHGPRPTIELAGKGHAAAFEGLRLAKERLASPGDQLFLVCAVDSYLDRETIEWLCANGRLRGKDRRGGFVVGEASAALLVASGETSRRLGIPSLARVRGIGLASEEHTIDGEAETRGLGLSAAISKASSGLHLPNEAADATYCDINGERYRVEEWGTALQRSRGALKNMSYESPAMSCGDVGAASSALAGVLAVQSWARDYAPGPRGLIWASSDGGLRGAAVLEAPQRG